MAAKRSIQYIPAIDGLRALAVIAVMFYHLGFSWIPGGFLGVDLFFVISGYVITRMLLDSIAQSGGLDLRGFYLARLRRLLPALLFMLTTTVIAVEFGRQIRSSGYWSTRLLRLPALLIGGWSQMNKITLKASAVHLFCSTHGHLQ